MFGKRKHFLQMALAASLLVARPEALTAEEILVRDGQKVAFLGDSITANGWSTPGGYVKLVVDGLAQKGIRITPIPAGVSGNKSNEMLARLDSDVLSKNPDWLTLSCGVNDVWHGAKGVDLESYKKNIAAIVDQAQARKINVVILTATVIGEDANDNNRRLVPYNDFLKAFAKERNLPLADLNGEFHRVLDPLSPTKDSRYLTGDGVHMNPEGNVIMARGCLQAFGLSAESVASIEKAWEKQKGTATIGVYPFDPRPNLEISLAEYRGLKKIAEQRSTNSIELGRSLWLLALAEAVEAHKTEPVLKPEEIKKEAQDLLGKKIAELVAAP